MQQWGSPVNANYWCSVGDASTASLQSSTVMFYLSGYTNGRVVYQKCCKLMVHSDFAKEEMQASFMFMLVVRAPVYMRLHDLTGSCVLGPFLTDLYINPRVQGRLTFFTLNSLSCSIHNLEGSMFISEQDTRINPQGQIHFWAPVDIPLCALGVL